MEPRKEGIIIKKNGTRKTNSYLKGINRKTTFEGTWPNDLICSGSVQAQLRTKSWVGETLGLGPNDDVTKHAGNVAVGGATRLVGLGRNVTRGTTTM